MTPPGVSASVENHIFVGQGAEGRVDGCKITAQILLVGPYGLVDEPPDQFGA